MSLAYLEQIGKAKDKVKQIANTSLGRVAKEFAEQSVETMKDGVPTASGTLKASIGVEFKAEGTTFSIQFLADDYWDFINSGVDGVQRSSGALINEFGDTYSFKTLNPSKKMVDEFSGQGSMQNWLASKGITSLTFGGETHQLVTDSDYRGAAYVFARAVKRHGIKPSEFVNNAFTEEKLQAFDEAILDAFEEII
jgi:hypothetical protein